MSGLRYVGGGFIQGVPGRDLTEEEAAQFGRTKLIRSGLYIEAEPDEAKEKPRPAENKMAAGPQENKGEV